MTGSTLIALVFALFAVGAITMLLFASALARRLVESRALSLPPDLLLRMREEWQSELDHLGSSVAQLTFALRLFLTRSQTFIDAASPSDSVEGEGGQVALSVDDLRIVPGPQEFRSALSGDSLTLMVPIAVLIWLHVAAGSLVLASYAWSLVWALVTHLISVRLWGGTPGMLWAGVRIIRWDGSPLEWRHICNRAVAASLWVFVWFLPSVAFALWVHRRWGDRWFSGVVAIFLICESLRLPRVRAINRRLHELFASGTILIMKIPTVVDRARIPRGSTSPMR